VALALILCARPAWAGYIVAYSGGSATLTSSSGTSSSPYSLNTYSGSYGNQYTSTGWGTETGPGGTTVATSGSAHCQGEITATFTWQTNSYGYGGGYGGGYGSGAAEDPPRAVVVKETCEASWDSGNATGTGSSSNGLGFAQQGYAPNGTGGSSSGTRYNIVENPGASFTVHCTPDALVSGTGVVGPPSDSGGGRSYVSYNASAEPLEVVLSGGIGTKNSKRYLIGQHVGASLSTGGLIGDTFSWSVSGGEPFGDYTADQTTGHFDGAWPATANPTGFYFKKPVVSSTSGLPIPVTVTCSAHLNVPAGALPAAGLDVATDRQCTAEPPATATLGAAIGSVSLIGTPPNLIGLGGVTDPTLFPGDVGITWEGSVATPSDFTASGTGSWTFVQLVTASRFRVKQGTAESFVKNGQLCLDNWYPYDGTFAADGQHTKRVDSPSAGLSSNSQALDSVNALDSFGTWLMYLPPGGDSRYIPIRKIKWFWHGIASRSTTAPYTWSMTSSPTDRGWSFDGDPYPSHPEWSVLSSNSDLDNYTTP